MNIKKFTFDTEARSSSNKMLLFLPFAKQHIKKEYLSTRYLFVAEIESDILGTINRAVVSATHTHSFRYQKVGHKRKLFFIDCITGTVYNPRNGECLSSYKLQLKNIINDKQEAMHLLQTARTLDETRS